MSACVLWAGRRLAPMLRQSPVFAQALAADDTSVDDLNADLTPSDDVGKD